MSYRSADSTTTPLISLPPQTDDCEDSGRSDVEYTGVATRTPFVASSSTSNDLNVHAADIPSSRDLLYPHYGGYAHGQASVSSTASNTPVPSRAPSPLPMYISSGASSCSSDSDSELDSPLLDNSHDLTPWRRRRGRPNWWEIQGRVRRRRRRDSFSALKTARWCLRKVFRHRFFPKTPLSIIITILVLAAFGVSLTFLLLYVLNPDKEPLPWRGYCTIPQLDQSPPALILPPTASFPYPPPDGFTPPSFPPPNLDSLSPAGILLGVFSMDSSTERRMLVRSTWASHPRSRNGAGQGDGGVSTSRTVVRFILGQPRKEWERRVRLEMEMYNDMVILPVSENMNDGKTHAFFTWASANAWVPPLYIDSFDSVPTGLSYTNDTSEPPRLAVHDPAHAWVDAASMEPKAWVRPDYVAKVDDDAFVMLAELESRLRVELHSPPATSHESSPGRNSTIALPPTYSADPSGSSADSHSQPLESRDTSYETPGNMDPLIFWGYLVKNRFMAGELYALSYSLAHWVANDPVVKTLTSGAEDKQTSKWMRMHPRASEVRWASERCWIYDHPRAGTVYSHGFLFPSEATRVQKQVMQELETIKQQEQEVLSVDTSNAGVSISPFGPYAPVPARWAQSSVSTFGSRYSLAKPNLPAEVSVEALVEGSLMSQVGRGSKLTASAAWEKREGRNMKYENKRVGGTIVVHFIKKNMWFLETAMAFLQGEDETDFERITGGKAEDVTAGTDIPETTTRPATVSRGHTTSTAAWSRRRW